jgi:hypothetical protein
MEVWALSFATSGEVVQSLMKMTNGEPISSSHYHKKESAKRILSDEEDRQSLRDNIKRIIGPRHSTLTVIQMDT